MTEIARPIGKGRMRRIIDDSRPVRSVHAVTRGAAAVAHGIIHVLFDEKRLVDLMADFTERRHLILEKSNGLRRCVRVVTVETPFLNGVVLELGLCDQVHPVFMTSVAQLVTAVQEIVLILGGMRVMTLDTLAFQGDFMRTASVLRQNFSMAGETDPAHFSRQLFGEFRRMGVVTRRASRFQDRGVDERFLQLALEVGMAGEAYLLLGSRLQPEPAFLAFLAFLGFLAFLRILRCFCRLGRFRRLLRRFRVRMRRETEAHGRKNSDQCTCS